MATLDVQLAEVLTEASRSVQYSCAFENVGALADSPGLFLVCTLGYARRPEGDLDLKPGEAVLRASIESVR